VAASEILLLLLSVVVTVAAALLVWAALRGKRGPDPVGGALSRGDFGLALALGEAPGGGRREWLAAALAARHLLLFDRAAALTDRILAADANDAEARIERALGLLWQRRYADAERELERALLLRPDLAEPIGLHRAFLAERQGDLPSARRRFEEIAAALENKLRADLGPGDALFADWFLEASLLWAAQGDEERAAWAGAAFARGAPQSRLRAIA
jgi:tetratricopeptide (TPR) repeat protein